MSDTPTSDGTPSAREIIAGAQDLQGGVLTFEQVQIIAHDLEYRLTPIHVRCASCRFTAAAQDIDRLVRYFLRGKDADDYIRDYLLTIHLGDVERIVALVLDQMADVTPGMTADEIREAIERRKRKQQD